MIVDNTQLMADILERKIATGLGEVVFQAAENYRAKVTENQVVPPGSRTAQRSVPGQYPFRDFGDGERNIAWGVSLEKLQGVWGLKEDGLHLVYLVARGRLGPVESFIEDIEELQVIFANATASTN